ncbi:acyltransferase [Paenibacillus albidus]|uniref:acyltransferase family protein n=1 Tax=Paenibacillus albidus TaxID=2041023 RepID=UPI001BEB7D6E|nr:acyltransferase [Paenibacillus albidus]MBT2290228.1 acyltransferase [Paenibacillus albidus]
MQPVKKERLFYLDFIRALSVLSIVIFHFNASLGTRSIGIIKIFFDTYPNGNLGRIGVSLFFILSGAALMFTYQKKFALKNYIKKRFLAIFPIFWIAYAIVLLYYFYKYYAINPFSPVVPKWTFVLSLIGMDGYLVALIPNFYMIGEWFLGCIIILYGCFPLLRPLVIKYPKILAICALIIYVAVVQNYIFKIQIDYNIFARLPEFLFGMYFVRYIKKINFYQFGLALLISVLLFVKEFNINYMYLITITGISLFFVLAYIAKFIKNEIIQKPFVVIGKYSFAIFLVHHVIIEQVLERFTGRVVTPIETYALFLINCMILSIVSFYLYNYSNKVVTFVKAVLPRSRIKNS